MTSTSTTSPSPFQELSQQLLTNKAMENAGFPMSKLNEMLSVVSNSANCDSACQRARTGEELRQKWETAKNNLVNAPEDITLTEKNYYVFENGDDAYNEMILNRNVESIQKYKQESLLKHKSLLGSLNNSLGDIKTSSESINELKQVQTYFTNISNSLDNMTGFNNTNNRMVVYELDNMDLLNSIRKILNILYLFLFAVFIFKSDFISRKLYTDKKYIVAILIYICIYFFLDWIVVKLYLFSTYIYYLFSNRPYKDIFYNLTDNKSIEIYKTCAILKKIIEL